MKDRRAISDSRFWGLTLSAGVLIRAGLIAAACLVAGISVSRFALLHDGWEYLRLARAFAQGGVAGLPPATLRLFWGYPLLIDACGMGRAYILPGLAISILCGAACGPLASRLGRDRRLAWWMLCATPSWLIYSSTVMSDGLALILTLAALTLTVQRRWALAGIAAGLAFCVRPVGALLFLPLAIEAFAAGGRRALFRALAAGLPLPIVYLLANRLVLGDALQAVRQYSAQDFAWPLSSLLGARRNPNMSAVWIAYQSGVLAVTWLGAAGLWRRVRGGEGWMRPLLAWHLLGALFYLLLPSSWAFQGLDRFYLAVWPTTLIGLAPWLPRRRAFHVGLVSLLGVVSFWLALRWLAHLAAVFPFAERAF